MADDEPKVSALTAFAHSNAQDASHDVIEDNAPAATQKPFTLKQFAQAATTDTGEVGEDIIADTANKPSKSLKSVASAQRMSLVDFAQQQHATVTSNDAASTQEASSQRSSLMDIAKSSATDAPESRKTAGRVSLVDVANATPKSSSLMEVATSKPRTSLLESVKKQQAADNASLVEIAKANKVKQTSTVAKVLGAIAREERAVIGNQIEHKMKEARDEVRHDQNQAAHDALRSAVREVQYDDEFEYESSADKINRAVDILVQKQQPESTPPALRPTMSVDRDVLRSRQGRGLQHACPNVKSRQSQLSSYQLNQLTETQKRLLYATLVEYKPPSSTRDNQAHLEYINRIAKPLKPKKRVGKEQYARESDRRHCKFKPRVGRGSAESGRRSDDDDDNGRDNQDFIRRMEAAEKAKRDGIQRQRAERIYIAQLDKKECPKCGNPQSYSEVQQKRKQCPNCGVTYRSRLAWGDISHEFFERVELSEEQRLRNLDQISMDVTTRFRVTEKRVFDRHRNCMVTVKAKPLTWDEVEHDFLTRVRLDASNRITNREELEQKFYGSFTYHPHITAHAKRMEYVRFEERMQKDIDQRLLRQEQNKITAAARALYKST